MSRSIPTRRPAAFASAAVLALAVLVAACSAGTPSRNELVEALKTSGVPADVARCAADAMEDSLSSDQLAQIVERGPGGAPADDAERTDDPSDKVRAALAVCREDLPVTTVPGTTAPGTVPGASTVPSQGTTTSVAATTVPASSGATETAPAAGSDADGDAGIPGTDDTGPAFDTVPPSSGG
jgi:hypothetical protein